MLSLARDFYANPTASLPQACASRAKTKAAYRFVDHEHTTMDTLLQPHYRATQERMRGQTLVLAVQDTTSLSYTTHKAMTGLGAIGTTVTGPKGLELHSTLSFDVQGLPLGFIDAQCWARDPAEFGKKALRHKLPIEQKESHKWLNSYQAAAAAQARCPNTLVLSVGDREADIYELFEIAAKHPQAPNCWCVPGATACSKTNSSSCGRRCWRAPWTRCTRCACRARAAACSARRSWQSACPGGAHSAQGAQGASHRGVGRAGAGARRASRGQAAGVDAADDGAGQQRRASRAAPGVVHAPLGHRGDAQDLEGTCSRGSGTPPYRPPAVLGRHIGRSTCCKLMI